MSLLYFEDFSPGQTKEYGAYRVTREEIIAFASQFDPQPFHIDDEAAKSFMLGGLAASGWHIVCMLMRMNYDNWVCRTASMGAPGVDEVRWLKPVRPGDTLKVRSIVLEARRSRSRPEMGLVKLRFELFNQGGALVMTQQNAIMVEIRNPIPRAETSSL